MIQEIGKSNLCKGPVFANPVIFPCRVKISSSIRFLSGSQQLCLAHIITVYTFVIVLFSIALLECISMVDILQ